MQNPVVVVQNGGPISVLCVCFCVLLSCFFGLLDSGPLGFGALEFWIVICVELGSWDSDLFFVWCVCVCVRVCVCVCI